MIHKKNQKVIIIADIYFLFKKEKKEKIKKGETKKKKGENRSIKLNINQKAIPV